MKAFKKCAFLFLALLMLIFVLPETQASAAVTVESGECGDRVEWRLDDEGVLTISGKGEMSDFNGPWVDSLQPPWKGKSFHTVVIEKGVESVSNYAFYGCTEIRKVTIAGSVEEIDTSSFEGCTGLAVLELSEGIEEIGYSAFNGCTALGAVIIPESVEELSDFVFSGCTGLSFVKIPQNVSDMGYGVFEKCTGLTYVEIAEGVTEIGHDMFDGCKNLKAIEIPQSVTSIGASPFSDCPALTKITVDIDNDDYMSIDGVLYDKACTKLVCFPQGKKGAVRIPEGITALNWGTFTGCSGITSITIPKSMNSVEIGLFADCTALTEILVNENNANYSSVDGVLYNKNKTQAVLCPKGKTGAVTVPYGVTTIGESAFYNCSGLTEVTLPDTVTSTGPYAFYFCSALKEFAVPKNVTSLSNYTFAGCSALETVTIPEGVTSIGLSAFGSCRALKSIQIPSSVISIGNAAFRECRGITSVTIPKNVTSLGDYAFYDTGIKTVIFEGSAPATGYYAPFYGVAANAYYPKEDATWAESARKALGSGLTWKAYKLGSDPLAQPVVEITAQPQTAYAALGEKAKFSVKAEGDGLIYQWYYRSAGSSSFKKTSGTSAAYSLEMTEARKDRELCCVITDQYGNSVQTNTVAMRLTASITSEPETAYTALNKKAKFTVKAVGDGLAYQWYYKDTDGKEYKKCSGTEPTYSLEMTEARKDRKLYCVVTDKYGRSVQTRTVTMKMAASVKTQPKTQYTQLGEKAKFTVKAVGDDLKYQWYYKSAGSSKYKKASCTNSSYTITMTEDRKDRAFYCIVTDKNGNEVKSKTVTMKLAASIKTEPKTQYVQLSDKAKFTVKAVGDGLKYQWYYKDTDGKKYKKASCTKATYSIELTKARNGRKFYCVITDKYGNTVKTKTVSMKKK